MDFSLYKSFVKFFLCNLFAVLAFIAENVAELIANIR